MRDRKELEAKYPVFSAVASVVARALTLWLMATEAVSLLVVVREVVLADETDYALAAFALLVWFFARHSRSLVLIAHSLDRLADDVERLALVRTLDASVANLRSILNKPEATSASD